MEWLIVVKVAFKMEKTKNVLLASRCLRQFIATGQNANGMTPLRQTFGYFVAPLGIAAWPGRGKEVREKKDPHLVYRFASLKPPFLSATRRVRSGE